MRKNQKEKEQFLKKMEMLTNTALDMAIADMMRQYKDSDDLEIVIKKDEKGFGVNTNLNGMKGAIIYAFIGQLKSEMEDINELALPIIEKIWKNMKATEEDE